jgi:ribosomal protein L34E
MTPTEAARILGAQRRQVSRNCAACGKPIRGITRKLYCGNTCAARASRAKRKEQRQ